MTSPDLRRISERAASDKELEWLSDRVAKTSANGAPAILKVARSPTDRALLRQEWRWLSAIDAPYMPRPISFEETTEESRLIRGFATGKTLDAYPERLGFRTLVAIIGDLHAKGVAHCDLRPENIVCSDRHVVLLDWEFAAPLGASISALPCRPFSSGWTHPNLIWGRSEVTSELDFFALRRMAECGFLLGSEGRVNELTIDAPRMPPDARAFTQI